jgi:hypothetical protein
MFYRIHQLERQDKICQQSLLPLFEKFLPRERVLEALQAERAFEQRERQFNMLTIVYLLLAIGLYPNKSIQHVIETVWHPLRQCFAASLRSTVARFPAASSFTQRRYQLTARVLWRLFRTLCRPMATEHTPGAFWKGRRLMAIDGTLESLPDTPANERAFGRLSNGKKANPFPQIRGVYLLECGTHAIVDAVFSACHIGEPQGTKRLLRSVTSQMLLMWDSGNHGYPLLARAVQLTGAAILARIPSGDKPLLIRPLSDGSWLGAVRPSQWDRGERHLPWIAVRIITYRIKTPLDPDPQEMHRLITTLLDENEAPAVALVELYHQRWEIEVVIDEIDTHQRLVQRRLRSERPVGVIQELYAVLIVHYIIRAFMHQSALQGQLDPDRLSFTHAIEVISRMQGDLVRASSSCEHEELVEQVRDDLRARLLPERRLRFFPRVVKQGASKFESKRPEHLSLPQFKKGTTFQMLLFLHDPSDTSFLLVNSS